MANVVKYEVSLPVTFLKEGRHYVAYSPALDLSTAGSTFELAKKRFEEVVGIFFEEITEKGTLGKVLSDLGWQKIQKEWIPPTVVLQESTIFKVPLYN